MATPPAVSVPPWPRRLRLALLDLLLPPRCAGCQRRGVWLCPTCQAAVPALGAPWCLRCGNPQEHTTAVCHYCANWTTADLNWLRSAYPHRGAWRKAIHRFKYNGERARAQHLGASLVPLLATVPAAIQRQDLLLVPVPLNSDRQRERGYNQSTLLAQEVAAISNLPLLVDLLRVRATRPQVGLGWAERRENVAGAFAWTGQPLRRQSVLLIDDVLTTGATANACAAALHAAGAGWVGLLTVARAVHQDRVD